MKNYIISQNRKIHQRNLNKVMRHVNRIIEQDSLWRGRFIVRQDAAQWFAYPGEKDYNLYVVLKLIDKKTKRTHSIAGLANHFTMWNGSHLFWAMNDFIVNDCKVWENEGREALYSDKTDWSKI